MARSKNNKKPFRLVDPEEALQRKINRLVSIHMGNKKFPKNHYYDFQLVLERAAKAINFFNESLAKLMMEEAIDRTSVKVDHKTRTVTYSFRPIKIKG